MSHLVLPTLYASRARATRARTLLDAVLKLVACPVFYRYVKGERWQQATKMRAPRRVFPQDLPASRDVDARLRGLALRESEHVGYPRQLPQARVQDGAPGISPADAAWRCDDGPLDRNRGLGDAGNDLAISAEVRLIQVRNAVLFVKFRHDAPPSLRAALFR